MSGSSSKGEGGKDERKAPGPDPSGQPVEAPPAEKKEPMGEPHTGPPQEAPPGPVPGPMEDPASEDALEQYEAKEDSPEKWEWRQKSMQQELDKGLPDAGPDDSHVHHIMPKTEQFAWFFRVAGINVHDRQFLRVISERHHRLIHGPYLREWRRWIYENTDWAHGKIPTQEAILAQAAKMDAKYLTIGAPRPADNYRGYKDFLDPSKNRQIPNKEDFYKP